MIGNVKQNVPLVSRGSDPVALAVSDIMRTGARGTTGTVLILDPDQIKGILDVLVEALYPVLQEEKAELQRKLEQADRNADALRQELMGI